MRRRATDFRRPVRKRVPDVLWWALCVAVVLLFIYILTRETQIESIPALSKVLLFFQFVFVDFCSYLPKNLYENSVNFFLNHSLARGSYIFSVNMIWVL